MSHIHAFCGRRGLPDPSAHEFASILQSESAAYSQSLGREFTCRTQRAGSLMVGQITCDLGIQGHRTWYESPKYILTIAGVCEELLGWDPVPLELNEFCARIESVPDTVHSHSGRFSMLIVNKEVTSIMAVGGGIVSVPLWYTDGPNGWAVGNRGIPLTRMVGNRASLNRSAALTSAAFGYLALDQSLLNGVYRLHPTSCLTGNASGEFQVYRTTSLGALLGRERVLRDDDAIPYAAEQIKRRVRLQWERSTSPIVLLTGGRDSRLIAAALQQSGCDCVAWTRGGPGLQATLARRVADRLRWRHHTIQEGFGHSIEVPNHLLRSLEWSRHSEGMETIRHAYEWMIGFYQWQLPFPSQTLQFFHGHGGEMIRGRYYHFVDPETLDEAASAHDRVGLVKRLARAELRDSSQLHHHINRLIEELNEDLAELDVTVAQWLDFLYWQVRCVRWSADLMSVRDPILWHWTPLYDRSVINLMWRLGSVKKANSRLIDRLTVHLVPELADVPYDNRGSNDKGPRRSVRRYCQRVLKSRYNIFRSAANRPKHVSRAQMASLWHATVLESRTGFWTEFLDRKTVEDLIRSQPGSPLLWNLATIELFERGL